MAPPASILVKPLTFLVSVFDVPEPCMPLKLEKLPTLQFVEKSRPADNALIKIIRPSFFINISPFKYSYLNETK
jgi:hypothetical protein